jgi:hypothetical protein
VNQRNRKQFLNRRKKGKSGGGGGNGNGNGNGGARSGTKGKVRNPDNDDMDNKRTIYGKSMYYHFRGCHWDKTPAQIATAKKYIATKAANMAAAEALLIAGK